MFHRRRTERLPAQANGRCRPSTHDIFERFNPESRNVLVLADEEALQLDHSFIGTEHILLGLIGAGGVAGAVLASFDITPEKARAEIAALIGKPGAAPSRGSPPFTPRALKVLELSLVESLQLGHDCIGTEHLLLGLVREGQGVGAQVLRTLAADLSLVRQRVIQVLSGYQGGEVKWQPGERTSGAEMGDEEWMSITGRVGEARQKLPAVAPVPVDPWVVVAEVAGRSALTTRGATRCWRSGWRGAG
jgi:ATP-dependent Clp protease ATP-binding subunit ClpC